MWFGLFTLFTALAIAGVAAWFSIEGLMAIFSASALPIAIMAGTLEVGKLLTASWLYRYWEETSRLMKVYLCTAVLVLMLITSMGIFGYLSKAHLDQAGESSDAFATVERIEQQIARENNKIQIIQERIGSIGGGVDNSQSITQQETIRDGAWERVQGDIDYNQSQIDSVRTQLAQDIAVLDARLATLDEAVNNLREKGVEVVTLDQGGAFRSAETEKIDYVAQANELFTNQKEERDSIAEQKKTLREQATADIKVFQDTIDRYRTQAQEQINNANAEINRLRDLTNSTQDDNLIKIDEYNIEIDGIYDTIAGLNDEKFAAESIVRNLEKEVGPIKYVAQLIYGGDSQDYLDQAVRLFILMLVFVFDPLAVVLVIAANQTLLRYGINFEKGGPDDDGDNTPGSNNNAISENTKGTTDRQTDDKDNSEDTSQGRNTTDDGVHLQQVGTTGLDSDVQQDSQSIDLNKNNSPSAVDDAAIAMAESANLKKRLDKITKQLKAKPKVIEKIIEKEADFNIDLTPPKAILDLEKKLQKRLDDGK